MKKIVLSLAVIGSLAAAEPAASGDVVEENGFYLGAGAAALSARDSEVSMDFFDEGDQQDRLGNFTIHAGYWVMDYLAIEARISTGFQDEDVIEMDTGWSIFLKPTYQFDDDEGRANGENYFSVYGLLGFGGVSFQGVNRVMGEVDETGFQWGVGMSYTFRARSDDPDYTYRDNWTLFADYTCLGRDMEGVILNYPRKADADALTVGIVYHF